MLVGYGALALTRFSYVLDLGQYIRLRPAVKIPPQPSVRTTTRPVRRGPRARSSPPKVASVQKSPSRSECEREIKRYKRKAGQCSGEHYCYWVDRLRKALELIKVFRPLTPPEQMDMGTSYTDIKKDYDAWIKDQTCGSCNIRLLSSGCYQE